MTLLKYTAFTLLVGLLLVCAASAQDVARARGDSLRSAGELVGAVASYRDALSRDVDDADTAFMLASTYVLHPQFLDEAFESLALAIRLDSTMKPLWHADLFFMAEDDRWAQVEETQLDKLATQVTGTLDREYARHLLRIRMREHAYRYHVMLAFRQLGPQSPLLPALTNAMQEHHHANLAHLQRLIEDKGWPAISRVGAEAAYAAGNVINHSDLATRQQYLPLLKAACEQGEADWPRYAHILDRTELELGHPQVYGTQMEQNQKSGRYEPRPMVDPERVDERRAEKGMEPISEQLRRFNASMQRDFGASGN